MVAAAQLAKWSVSGGEFEIAFLMQGRQHCPNSAATYGSARRDGGDVKGVERRCKKLDAARRRPTLGSLRERMP
jgi:hypothetical protein